MFWLYGWLPSELAEMPCEQWSFVIVPPTGEMCLIDHSPGLGRRAASHREKKKSVGSEPEKNKIDPFDRPRRYLKNDPFDRPRKMYLRKVA